MKKRYIQCGAEYRINPSRDPYQNYVATGLNTGNLYIGYAVNSLFKTKNFFNIWTELSDHEVSEIKENFDVIVMGASNFINKSTNFEIPARNLKKLKLPIIVLGIGAQASSNSIKKIHLTKGTENFLNVISEYSESLGVRGEYTAEILSNMGITNFTIIGCPTLYLNKDINFKIKKDSSFNELNIALNYTDISQKCDEKILQYAFNNNLDIIGQTEYIEEYWKRGLNYNYGDITKEKALEKEKKYTKSLKVGIDEVKKYMSEHLYQFYDIDQWASHIKKYNFLFGTRFHGNMIALQNGIPSLLVTHDSRTKELADYCNIPYIEAKNLIGDIDLEQLYSEVDYSKFNKEYANKFHDFIEFLNKNKVTDIELINENKGLAIEPVAQEGDLSLQKNTVSIFDNYAEKLFNSHNVLYKCPLENIEKLKSGPDVTNYSLQDEGLHIQVVGNDPKVTLPNFVNLDHSRLFIKLVITAPTSTVLELFYEEDGQESSFPYSESQKVTNSLQEGKNEIYLTIEAESIVKSLRLDVGNEIGNYILHELEIRS